MTVDNEYNRFFVVIAWSGEVIMRDWLTWMFISLLLYQHANCKTFSLNIYWKEHKKWIHAFLLVICTKWSDASLSTTFWQVTSESTCLHLTMVLFTHIVIIDLSRLWFQSNHFFVSIDYLYRFTISPGQTSWIIKGLHM